LGESYDLGRRIGELTYRIKNLEQIVDELVRVFQLRGDRLKSESELARGK
jgi:hypothetical protein